MTNKEYIKMLKERDEAKPLIKSEVILREDGKPHGLCPNCKYPALYSGYVFCPYCGQRWDRDNWAL